MIGKLAEANDLRGVIDVADSNDGEKLGKGKEMVDRLSNLVGLSRSNNHATTLGGRSWAHRGSQAAR